MGEQEDRQDAAKWRLVQWAIKNPIIMGLIGLSMGGGGGAAITRHRLDPRIEQLIEGQNKTYLAVTGQNLKLDDHETRISKLEDDRLADVVPRHPKRPRRH